MAEQKEKMSGKYEEADQVPGRQRNVESARSDDMLCMPCLKKDRRTTASVYCQTCNEFQCSDCSKIHEVYAFMKTHQLMDMAEARTNPVTFDMKGLDKCDQHQEILKFFCENDNQLCCSTCAIVDHRKCQSVVEIQKIAGTSGSTSSKLKVRLQEVREKAEMVVKITNSSKQQLAQDVKGVQLTIKRMRDEVMEMFDDLEVSVAKDAETFKTETLDKLTKKQANSQKHIADATKYLETMVTVDQNATPSQQFIVEQKIEKQANELCSNVEEECQNLETVTVSFDFDEKLTLPPLPISDYVPGQLTLKYSLSDDVTPIAPVDRVDNLTKMTSIDLKQTGDDVEEPLYTGLDFLPDGRLVAVDNNNKKCLIYNEKLEKVGSYQLSYHPQSIVAVSEEEVAITSGNQYQVDFLHVSKSNEITLNSKCKVTTRYESICLKDEGHFVVGTIDDTRPVRIVSLAGEVNDFSFSFPNKKYPISTSACTYIRNSDKVVLTDRYEHIVYIYDIVTDTRVVVKDDQINEPRGVAVGQSDCILVCSNETHSIVQITPTGRILSSYKLDITFPYRVCVSKDKSIIAVTNNMNAGRKLQLLKVK